MAVLRDYTLTQFDFLRHGQCHGGDIFRGTTDVLLTPEGEAAMAASCEDVQEDWTRVISSPMQRCCVFAEHYAQQKNIPFATDPRLREICFGVWEGRERSAIWEEQPQQIQAWLENPADNTPPGGEPLADVAARLTEFFEQAREQYRNEKLLVVAHGGVMRVMLSVLLDVPLTRTSHFDVPFASMSRIRVYEKGDSRLIKLAAHNFAGRRF